MVAVVPLFLPVTVKSCALTKPQSACSTTTSNRNDVPDTEAREAVHAYGAGGQTAPTLPSHERRKIVKLRLTLRAVRVGIINARAEKDRAMQNTSTGPERIYSIGDNGYV